MKQAAEYLSALPKSLTEDQLAAVSTVIEGILSDAEDYWENGYEHGHSSGYDQGYADGSSKDDE